MTPPPRYATPHHDAPSNDSSPPVEPPAVITTVKEKRPRHRKGEAKAKPGKKSWVHGTKLKFFASRKEQWLRVSEEGRTGDFYQKMGKLYVLKYGYLLADDQDLAHDVEDPSDAAAEIVVHETLSPEEQKFRTEYQKTLKSVRACYRTSRTL
jgi:hypothetical protein